MDYPIVLDLKGRLCVIVGAGPVGIRKANGVLKAGSRVRIIDPAPPQPQSLPAEAEILLRPYQDGDLDGAFLAFTTTNCTETNAAVLAEAHRRNILINVSAPPGGGDFILPALLRRGALTVATSTTGRSPAMAAEVRGRLESFLGPEWEILIELAGALRQNKLTVSDSGEYNKRLVCRLLESDLPSLIADGNAAAIDRCLNQLFGEEVSLESLGLDNRQRIK